MSICENVLSLLGAPSAQGGWQNSNGKIHTKLEKRNRLELLTSSARTSSSYSWMPPPPYTQTPTSTTPGLSTVRQMASGEPLPVFQLLPWLVLVKRLGDVFTEWSEFNPSTYRNKKTVTLLENIRLISKINFIV